MGALEHVSVSQIETYRDCPRKWGFNKLDGIESPPGSGAMLGSMVHTVLEKYLLEGTEPDPKTPAGLIARAGLGNLPKPPYEVEKAFDVDIAGVRFTGRMDVILRDPLAVIDHKTTSDKRYALTAETLPENLQANVYAHVGMRETGSTEATVKWIYYSTKGTPKSWVVESTIVDGARHREIIARAAEDGRIMLGHSGKRALDLEPNWNACSKYGGCPHKRRCDAGTDFITNTVRPPDVTSIVRATEAADGYRKEMQVSVNPPEGPAPTPAANDFTLFIDCRPVRGSHIVVELAQLVRPILDQVCRDFGTSDVRLIEYGRGAGALSAALRTSLLANPLRGVAIVLMTRTWEGQQCLFLLSELAREIIQGL